MIDLRSDTVTLPSDEMREAARDAAVGDDVYGDDPTVNELEARAAELVGMEAALYVPSGTMGNQIAARVHTEPGQEALVDVQAHVYKWEVGGFAQLSGLQVRAFDAGESAVPTPDQIREHAREESLHVAGTGVVCLENTHNARGGVAIPKADIDAAAEAAHELGIPVHLDGARVFNACVALDEDPNAMVENVDTVMFCLSKGLGAPVGSMLAGPEEFIEEATRVRKQFGGGMRQAGIIAAPGLVALDNVDRLADDHENARVLAEGLDAVDGLSVPTPDTNIVVVDSEDAGLTAEEFVDLCEGVDVLGGPFGEYHTRFTTNLDVSRADVEEAVERVAEAVQSQ
ncbi:MULTISPECIES: low specificity L-threonine aldolase [Haloferax]|uniref:Low specificity L-threonine aldolase n=1 Tax=Haloferax marinum TaxID=2666143 RepID=A0A6A8G6U6_9EURY|nr:MULTISPECIES: low specificity L-threonine aldolase [Haloferax]KAB1197482.1 low specificity L-threonine aldolase [Haloferax sp. CBA1150]MRW96527.1 low specificity L-threonine aldolase [Haloferax marinum]